MLTYIWINQTGTMGADFAELGCFTLSLKSSVVVHAAILNALLRTDINVTHV